MILGLGLEKFRMSLEHVVSYFGPSKKVLRESWGHVERSQPEGLPTGQIWDNLSIKINNDMNELHPVE